MAESEKTPENVKYWFGGKIRSKKQYDRLLNTQQTGRKSKGRKSTTSPSISPMPTSNIRQTDGYRLMSPDYLGKHMKCSSCNTYLSFENVEGEKRFGQASIFSIRCSNCLLLNSVSTGKTIEMSEESKKDHKNIVLYALVQINLVFLKRFIKVISIVLNSILYFNSIY